MHLRRGNLFLVGMPGCGKSTLGRVLARNLGKTFVDADHELERRLGVSISTIFEIEGEDTFRTREEETLARLVKCCGPDARICVLPEGPVTIPYVRSSEIFAG